MVLPGAEQIAAFRAVAREGSFSRAAAAVHKTQPALSQAVRGLEDLLGAKLFERRARATVLTPAGRAYLAHVERALAALEQGAEEVSASTELRSGELRIAASDTATCYVLPGLLRRFRTRFPGVELRIANAPSPEVARQVRAREVDLGVVTLPGSYPGVRALRLGAREDVAIFAAAHPLAQRERKRVRLVDLAREPLILLDRASATRRYIDARLRAAGVDPAPAMEVASVEVIKHLVALDLGVSIVPRVAIASELERGSLACASVLPRREQRSTGLLVIERGDAPAAARAFLDLATPRVARRPERRP